MGRTAPAPNLQPLAPATPARSARGPRPRGLVDLRIEARSPPLGAAPSAFAPGAASPPRGPGARSPAAALPPPPSPSATKPKTSDTNVPPPSATFALGRPASASLTPRAWALAIRSNSRSLSLWRQARYSPPAALWAPWLLPSTGAYAGPLSKVACWPLDPLRSQTLRLQRGKCRAQT